MIRRAFSHIDLMVRLLVLAIALASVLPATGRGYLIAQGVSNAAIFLLFLLNGLRLPRTEVLRGISHWQFLLPLTAWCFGAMAVAGKGFASVVDSTLPPTVALGLLYLGTLPSTVQSATAYSSLAGGNVANSVIAAALLNILGVFVTVPIISLLGGRAGISLGADGLLKVALILVLPFAIGQIFQNRAKGWIVEHRDIVTWMDRLSIAVAVYVAFSGAVSQGLWSKVGLGDWAALLTAVTGFLLLGFGGSWLCSRLLGLSRPDRISFLFAGAHKSVAMGAPLAAVLFPPAVAGMVLLPLLTYHLLQLVVSAPLANVLARDPNVG